ncbi:hypothetical protein SAMN04515679_3634 [Pelosinus fermentans]|nr:hypothetical protein FR7_03495 [Pelosinus fermentans DSM 17108]SDR28537.1 hypothetical protein SAMN04515679_3634 [Pelosinus fermentans]
MDYQKYSLISLEDVMVSYVNNIKQEVMILQQKMRIFKKLKVLYYRL